MRDDVGDEKKPRSEDSESQDNKPSDETLDIADINSLMDTPQPMPADGQDTAQFDPDATDATAGPASAADAVTQDASATQDFSAANDYSVNSGETADFRTGRKNFQSTIPERVGLYKIQKILGRGGMGIVYKAHHERLGRTVALKMVLAGAHASPDLLSRFISEAKAVAHLQHPNIVQIFEVGDEGGLPYFSLEFVDGESLDRYLSGKPIAPGDAADLTITLCEAMQYAHDHGVLHRDLKPANVLRSHDGAPKITDFGLAKRLEDDEDSSSTRTGTIMGTPSYMSPEQACGSTHEIGPASDQYSLGAMLYEFLTGRPPFLASRPVDTILQVRTQEPIAPRQLVSNLPADLETICLKALQKDPLKRYASCSDLAADLARFQRGEPIQARPVGQVERAWRWCRRNPLVASLSSAAALSLILVAAISVWAAWTVSSKNELLASSNEALNNANSDLKNKNRELDESNQENVRRTERLQSYVQDVFREVNDINATENPAIRSYKDNVLTKTLPLLEEIIRELPEGGQGVPTKISALVALGKSYRDQSQGDQAELVYKEAIRLARERVVLQAGSDASRSNLCLVLKDLSSIQSDLQRDVKGTIASLEEAVSIAQSILDKPTAAPNGLGLFPKYRAQFLLTDLKYQLGVARYRLGDPVGAVELIESTLSLRQTALKSLQDKSAFEKMEKPPTEDEQKKMVRETLASMSIAQLAHAVALSRCGRASEAEPILRGSYDQSEKSLSAEENNPLRMRVVAGAAGTLGEFLAWNDRLKEGGPFLRRAVEVADKMLEKNPESFEIRRAAGVAYHRYAQWLAHINNEDHKLWGQKGLDIRQRNAEMEIKSDRRQIEWMVSLSRYGDIAKSIEIADRFWERPQKDSELLTELAQAYAQCSVRASDAASQNQLQQKAIAALKAAVELGFKDSVLLAKEIDYQPLRELAEFKALVSAK